MTATAELREELRDLPCGWFHHGPLVLALLDEYRPKVVVELGSFYGASAIAMARSVRRWGGTVTCVDTWAWTGELTQDGGTQMFRSQSPLMILSCARAMVEAGVSASIRLIPARTLDAAAHWTGPIDFLYVDADHSFKGAHTDLTAWFPHVRTGGVMAGDDYNHPMYPGVKEAWDDFERSYRLRLTRSAPTGHGIQLVYGVKGQP